MPEPTVAQLIREYQPPQPGGQARRLSPLSFVAQRLRSSTFSPSARLAAFCLAARMNKTERCWPSIETVARDMGCGRSTAAKAIRELTDGASPPLFLKHKRKNSSTIYELVRHWSQAAADARERSAEEYSRKRGQARFAKDLETLRSQYGRARAGVLRDMNTRKVSSMPAGRESRCEPCGAILDIRPDGTVLDFLTQAPHVCPRA